MLLVYQLQQFNVQEEMEAQLNDPSAHFEQLSLSLADFEKARINDHEIAIGGKMYDYKSARISGNTVELSVINDTQEERILEHNKDLTQKNRNADRLLSIAMQLMLLDFIPHTPQVPTFFCTYTRSYPQLSVVVLSRHSEVLSPPPWLS